MHLQHIALVFVILISSSFAILLRPYRKTAAVQAPLHNDDESATTIAPEAAENSPFGHTTPGRDHRKRPFYYHNFPHSNNVHASSSLQDRSLDEKNEKN